MPKNDAQADALAASQKQSEEDNKAQLERTSSTQPTPTQAEIDRAKLGVESLSELDNKEADGSPEESTRATATDGNAGYANRSLSAKK